MLPAWLFRWSAKGTIDFWTSSSLKNFSQFSGAQLITKSSSLVFLYVAVLQFIILFFAFAVEQSAKECVSSFTIFL